MSFSKYKTFLEVVKEKSMSKAALNTNQTVPGVSYSISKLEDEWGLALFTRNRGNILLTDAGKEVLPHIIAILNEQHALERKIQSLNNTCKGTVRVGGLRCVLKQWLPAIIKEMNALYPDILIEIVLNPYEDIQNDITTGKIDVAFGGEPMMKMLDFHHIFDDPFVVVVDKANPLCRKKFITLDELSKSEYKIIMPCWSADKELMNMIKKNHIDEYTSYAIKDSGTIISMVESGMGISIMPYFVATGERADIGIIKLEDWSAKRFGIITAIESRTSLTNRMFIDVANNWLMKNREKIQF